MRTIDMLTAACALGLSLWAGRQESAEPGAPQGAVLEFEIAAGPGARAEHFALFRPGAGEQEEPLGLVRLVRIETREGGSQLEALTELFEIETRIHQVESRGPGGPKLVWREFGGASARTLLLERDPGGAGMLAVQWVGATDVHRHPLGLERSPGLPWGLVERVREGQDLRGPLAVFDPLGARVEPLIAETERRLLPGGLAVSSHRWKRRDGTLAGEWIFLGDRLVAWRRQAGGPVARRIPQELHGRLSRGH